MIYDCRPRALRLSRTMSMAVQPQSIPIDVLPLIFEYLDDRRDLHTCAQLCWTFNLAATPLLYRTLDSRIVKGQTRRSVKVLHPAGTLLKKPAYAKYVRHIHESSAVGSSMPLLLPDCQAALRLCVNLEGFSWSDRDSSEVRNDEALIAYLDILQGLKIKELTIHTYVGLSEEVWGRMIEFRGLNKVAIWTMEGQPRILQGWSEKLGPSLTHLELGRCTGVPASILVSVISHLPQLTSLRLKGAPTSAILEILTYLPRLVTLDTEYFGTRTSRYADVPAAALRDLTVRTSSVDLQGPQQLWAWIRRLLPRPSLESLTFNAFSTQGETTIPRTFFLELAQTQRETFKHLHADSALLTLEDVECICTVFPALESLSCSIAICQHPGEIENAISNGHNLREIKLNTTWVLSRYGAEQTQIPFDVEHARKLMLRERSLLRAVGIGGVLYTGKWVQAGTGKGLDFQVMRDVVSDW
ncbi:hypothetical protein WOLCODRAFT_140028 [Wolfiporia cocos MD-104 SS10]|uniref:F-box domain-containing protein n=1 Tax=Wolfiporia cocos (strain MD-104) TaxID=742152 RepID=A0A2H3JG59_WOLCO|nr:hypothetical protein WOLCODRAFT_140028 [Wolfiporia cocos MD-104 SS10]